MLMALKQMPNEPAGEERRLKRVAAVIAHDSALPQAGERADFLVRRVAAYVSAHGAQALDDLLQRAEGGDAGAVQTLRNALTVNYTYFWREAEHFQILLEHVLTGLRKRPAGAGLRLWSAACATGEEAWSMAIAAAEALRLSGATTAIEVLATDIDTLALERAAQGRYGDEAIQQLPADLRDRYLHRVGGAGSARWQVGEELRRHVRFVPLDLLAQQWPACDGGPPFDAIFCRNVMIYFSDSARFHVFEKFAALLQPDGLLFLSRVEGGVNRAEPSFRPCGDSVYLLRAVARRAGPQKENP
jgi:chemotaxis protein methyltransferase CheR